ncbi:MAG: hypothetical protein IJ689_00380 [Alphaproteobacteria bacterium]|nr:hypothetical protein [Alphaproteobacteria bacterium]
MDAKQAAAKVTSGNYTAEDFAVLYAALKGKAEYADAFRALRTRMLKEYAKGQTLEVSQARPQKTNQRQAEPAAQPRVQEKKDIVVDEAPRTARVDENQLHNNVEQWKIKRRQDIMQWVAKNQSHEIKEIKAVESGLNAEFKDGTTLNFVKEDHVSVKTPKQPEPKNFDVIVALAKQENRKVKLGENMSEEFRAALIEACAKADVQISNLTLEDLDKYMSFVAEKQPQAPQQTEEHSLNAAVNTGHTLKALSAEQLKRLQDNGFDVNETSVVDDQQWNAMQTVLSSQSQERKDNGVGEVVSAVAAHAASREAQAAEQKVDTPAQESVVAAVTQEQESVDTPAQVAEPASSVAEPAPQVQEPAQQTAGEARVQEVKQKVDTSAQDTSAQDTPADVQTPVNEGAGEAQPIPPSYFGSADFNDVLLEDEDPNKEDAARQTAKEEKQDTAQGKDSGVIVIPAMQGGEADPQEQAAADAARKQEEDAASQAKDNKKDKKKGSILSRIGNWFGKMGKKTKKVLVGAGLVLVAFVAGRSCMGCHNTGNPGDDKKDPRKNIELVTDTLATDSIADRPDTLDLGRDVVIAPRVWDESMTITKAQFDNMYNIVGKHDKDHVMWDRMYMNSKELAPKFGYTWDELMFKTMRMAAWTNALNGKACDTHNAKWAYTYSGAFGHIVGPTMEVIKCGGELDASLLAKAKKTLDAVGKDGRINVVALDAVVPGTSRYNDHDAQGWIIGHNRNVMIDMNEDCGRNAQVGFRIGGKLPEKVVQKVVEEEVDTVPSPVIHRIEKIEIPPLQPIQPVTPDLQIPNIHVDIPQPAPQANVAVGATANLTSTPGAQGVKKGQEVLANGSDRGLTKRQRKVLLRQAKDLYEADKLTKEEYQQTVREINGTKGNQVAPATASRGNSYGG